MMLYVMNNELAESKKLKVSADNTLWIASSIS